MRESMQRVPHKYKEDVLQDAGGTTYTNRCYCGKTKKAAVHQSKWRNKPTSFQVWLESKEK